MSSLEKQRDERKDDEDCPNVGALTDGRVSDDKSNVATGTHEEEDQFDETERQTVRWTTMWPSEEDDRAQGDWGKIPPHMHFAKLRRTLPAASSKDLLSFKDNEDQAKIIFEKLYDGEFAYQWTQDDTTLVFRVGKDDQVRSLFPRDETGDVLLETAFASNEQASGGLAEIGQPTFSPLMQRLFSPEQGHTLLRRVVHRFYRKHVSDIHVSHQFSIYRQLRIEYTFQSRYSDLVDITIAFADGSFMTECENMDFRMFELGKTLEAKGKFRDAALIYEDLTRGVKAGTFRNANELVDGTKGQVLAATAYQKAGNLEEAARCCVAALWMDVHQEDAATAAATTKWDINETETNKHISRFLRLMEYSVFKHGGEVTNLDLCFSPFVGLLHTAGFEFRHFSEEEVSEYAQTFFLPSRERLKTQVAASKKTAVKALRALFPSKRSPPDVAQFHSKLLSYIKPSSRGLSFRFIGTPMGKKEKKKMSMRDARQVVSDYTLNAMDMACCGNPACHVETEVDLSWCACRKIKYCCKGCQRAHWAVHKQTCNTRYNSKLK